MPGAEKPFVVRRRSHPRGPDSAGGNGVWRRPPDEECADEPDVAGPFERSSDDEWRTSRPGRNPIEPERPAAGDTTPVQQQVQSAGDAAAVDRQAQTDPAGHDAQDPAPEADRWEPGVRRDTADLLWGAAPEPAVAPEPPLAPDPPARRARRVDILAPEPEPAPFRGVHPGDRTFRLRRPRVEGVRRVDANVYEIVSEPDTSSRLVRVWRRLRRTLIGTPIRSEHEAHERLSNKMALAVFGADNISSSAYATEEIMRVLFLAGAAALAWGIPLSLAIVALLAIVVISYQQTIRAYPKGGGSYIVSSDNLGVIAGLVAGCSIQVGYILTVAVSVSAGVAALTSAFPALYENRVLIAIGAVAVMAWGNLRGIRESGTLFAAPAYLYFVSILGVIGYGLFRYVTGDTPAYVPPAPDLAAASAHAAGGAQALTVFLVLRAFTSGAVGLTGTEAIADGVSAFRPPEDRNARVTLVAMATCFATVFLGITFLAHWLQIIPDPNEVETVNSQLTRTLIGVGPAYYLVQFATALLLVLAANTAFADFPRLAYFLARDKFLPTQFTFRGGRLAFSNGILILAVVAAVLIVLFRGSVTALIPLYAVGVFVGFTLSQAALARRWWRRREPGWRWRLAVNATGATVTTIVAVVAAVTRFTQGAWVVLVLVPALVAILLFIQRHYRDVADQLAVDANDVAAFRAGVLTAHRHYLLIPVADLNLAALRAIDYARSLIGQDAQAGIAGLGHSNGTRNGTRNGTTNGTRDGNDKHLVMIQAVHVTDDADAAEALKERWERLDPGVDLVIVEAPYRALVGPILRYIDAIERRHPEATTIVTVLLPEFIPAHWWEHLLHTHTALQLKGALLFRRRTAVTSVPYHLHQ